MLCTMTIVWYKKIHFVVDCVKVRLAGAGMLFIQTGEMIASMSMSKTCFQ